jgi:hypothetical protein
LKTNSITWGKSSWWTGIRSKYRNAKEAGESYPWVYELPGTLEHDGVLKGIGETDFRKPLDVF